MCQYWLQRYCYRVTERVCVYRSEVVIVTSGRIHVNPLTLASSTDTLEQLLNVRIACYAGCDLETLEDGVAEADIKQLVCVNECFVLRCDVIQMW
jgi:hypothetical protein